MSTAPKAKVKAIETGAGSELPEGWVTARILDIFDCWGGMTPSTSNRSYWGGGIAWVSSKDVKSARIKSGADFITQKALEETRLRLCPVGSVVAVVRSGILANTFPIAVTEVPVTINQDLKAFWSAEPALNEWLATNLRALEPQILAENRKDGTTVQSIRVDQLKNLVLRIPPVAEQSRIAATIDSVLPGINASENHLAKSSAILAAFRQAVLVAAYAGRLTREFHSPGRDEWSSLTVGSTFESFGGGTPSRQNPAYWGGKIPWLSSGDIKADHICSSSETITKAGFDNSTTNLCRKGSIVVVVRSGILRHTLPIAVLNVDAAINQDLKCFDSGDDNLNVWLALAWRASSASLLQQNREGTTVQSVKYETLRDFELRIPPQNEQAEIIRRVEALFRLADAIERRIAAATLRAEKLTQAILAKAFRGELVPTEAELARREGREYEPAVKLLERIRTGRESNANANPKRPRKSRTAVAG